MLNRAICAARAAWYGVIEPNELRLKRRTYARPYFNPLEPWAEHRNPLVSVLIATHNRAELLVTRTLPSVLAQTYTNLEIIVAAHGCTDDTTRRVLALGDRRVYVIEVERCRTYPPTAENHWLAGPVAPLNAALKAATGAWIARIDDDDTWTPDHVERLLRFAQGGDYEFVSSAYETERDGERGIVWHDGQEPPIGGTQTWLWRSYLKFMRYNPDCWRKTWNRVNDTDLADRFRKAGVRIGWTPEVTARVLPRPGETTVGLAAYRRDTEATEAAFAFRT